MILSFSFSDVSNVNLITLDYLVIEVLIPTMNNFKTADHSERARCSTSSYEQ